MKPYTSEAERLNDYSNTIRNKKVRVLCLYLVGVFLNTIPILLSLNCSGDGCMVLFASKILFLYWSLAYLLSLSLIAFNADKKTTVSIFSFLPILLFVLLVFIWIGLDSFFIVLLFGTHNLIYAFIIRYVMSERRNIN